MAICSTCEYDRAVVKGECRTCYMWRRNHNGEQRPDSVIVRHGQRVLERMMCATSPRA